ncbi:hypothetical protein [Subtercola boreus]|nr:hypothetical protein [Subtercola boreus]
MNLPSLTSGLREQSGWQASEEVVPDFYALVPTQKSLEFWGRVGEKAPRAEIAYVDISKITLGVVRANRRFAAILLTLGGRSQPIPLVLFSARLFRFTPMRSRELQQYLDLVLSGPLNGESDRWRD